MVEYREKASKSTEKYWEQFLSFKGAIICGLILTISLSYYFGFNRGLSRGVGTELVTAKVIAPRYRIKKAPKKSEIATVPVAVKSGWYVQLSAERSLEEAIKYQNSLEALEVETTVDELKAGGRDFYRVLSGPFENRDQARQFSVALNNKSEGKVRPFVVFVK